MRPARAPTVVPTAAKMSSASTAKMPAPTTAALRKGSLWRKRHRRRRNGRKQHPLGTGARRSTTP
ncbi:MAG: hypothetical protein WAJ86_16480 [Candidatus Acidiferrales bacterium]